MLDFLINVVPWWVQVLILGAVVGVPVFLIASMIFGVKVATRYLVHGLLALATLGFASRLRQDGYRDRVAQEQKALDRAEDVVVDKRQDVDKMTDSEIDREIDRWTKR